MIAAGKLTQLLEFQTRKSARGGAGQRVDSWVLLCRLRAEPIYRTAAERVAQQAEGVSQLRRYRLRYDPRIAHLDTRDVRFLDVRKQQLFNVRDIDNIDEKNREIIITCEVTRGSDS